MPTIRLVTSADALSFIGPTLEVVIEQHSEAEISAGSPPDLSGGRYLALIDTGARVSCIDVALAEALGLAIVDGARRNVAGILGPGVSDVYLARISIPELSVSIAGRFTGAYLSEGEQIHHALIGRDILKNFTMAYDGRAGIVTLSND